MKILSVETLHIMFDKHIALTSAYMEDVAVSFIIRCCRLKPKDLIFGGWTEKIILYRHWIDEHGNTLEIIDAKKIKIHLNSLTYKDKLICSDLYENLPIDKIAKISKLAYFMMGQDEDLLQDHAIVSLLGIDGVLRSYCYIYGEWSKIPNLYLGYRMLREIAHNDDIKFFKLLKLKDMPYPCINGRAVLTCLPPNNEFISLLKTWNDSVLHTIKLGETKQI